MHESPEPKNAASRSKRIAFWLGLLGILPALGAFAVQTFIRREKQIAALQVSAAPQTPEQRSPQDASLGQASDPVRPASSAVGIEAPEVQDQVQAPIQDPSHAARPTEETPKEVVAPQSKESFQVAAVGEPIQPASAIGIKAPEAQVPQAPVRPALETASAQLSPASVVERKPAPLSRESRARAAQPSFAAREAVAPAARAPEPHLEILAESKREVSGALPLSPREPEPVARETLLAAHDTASLARESDPPFVEREREREPAPQSAKRAMPVEAARSEAAPPPPARETESPSVARARPLAPTPEREVPAQPEIPEQVLAARDPEPAPRAPARAPVRKKSAPYEVSSGASSGASNEAAPSVASNEAPEPALAAAAEPEPEPELEPAPPPAAARRSLVQRKPAEAPEAQALPSERPVSAPVSVAEPSKPEAAQAPKQQRSDTETSDEDAFSADRYDYLLVQPTFSSFAIDAVDQSTSATAKLPTQIFAGIKAGWGVAWSKIVRTLLHFEYDKVEFSPVRTRTFEQASFWRYSFGLDVSAQVFRNLELSAGVAHGQGLFARAPSVTTLAIDLDPISSLNASAQYAVYRASPFSLWLGAGADVRLPTTADSYTIGWGYGYQGSAMIRKKPPKKSYSYGGGLFVRGGKQDTSIATQKTLDIGLRFEWVWAFGLESEKPKSQ
jgi:hypothetical protein